MTSISVSRVETKKDLDRFQRVPEKIYADDPNWVPPILSMEKRQLSREEGAFFTSDPGSKAEYFIAWKGKEVVGRIAAIRNQRHLDYQKDGVGFFGFFESINDVAVSSALFEEAEKWLASEGLKISRGPASFTLGDAAGITIEGADLLPTILMGHTPPYYAELLQHSGYRKSRDLLGYIISGEQVEAFTENSRQGASHENIYCLRSLDRRNLEEEAELVARIFSESWKWNWGSYELKSEDLMVAVEEMGMFFDEGLAYVATVNEEPAAVFLLLPDPAPILAKLGGRIGLTGLLRLLRDHKKITRYRLIMFGSLPQFRTEPLAPLMMEEIHRKKTELPGLETVELYWILEDNEITRSLAESLAGDPKRRLRLFEKPLHRPGK